MQQQLIKQQDGPAAVPQGPHAPAGQPTPALQAAAPTAASPGPAETVLALLSDVHAVGGRIQERPAASGKPDAKRWLALGRYSMYAQRSDAGRATNRAHREVSAPWCAVAT